MTVTLKNNPYNIVINKNIPRIGDPIITFSNTLEENEIWLEGAIVSRTDYPNLYIVYGTTYGAGDGSTTFGLPDCTDRTFWGSNSFGYIEAGLPNIKGTANAIVLLVHKTGQPSANGAFSFSNNSLSWNTSGADWYTTNLTFDANESNSIYSDTNETVQTPSIKVRVKTRYK